MSASAEHTARAFWEERVRAAPDAPAIISEGRTWTYGQFDAWVNRLANGLRAGGAGAGTTVALLLPSSVELLRLELALAKLGAVAVPMIAGSTAAEVAYVLEHSGAELLITDPAGFAVTGPGSPYAYVAGDAPPGARPYSELESGDEAPPPDPRIGPLAPLAIMYTSGSTGRPKGVVQPSASLGTTGSALAIALRLDSRDTVLCSLPFFHTAATHMAFASAIAAGGRVALMNRFSRDGFWPLARETQATATYLFPAQMAILMTAPPTPSDRDNQIRVCFSHIRNEPFCERFGIDVCPGWALTETCGMGTLTRPGTNVIGAGQIGVPYPEDARVRVLADDGSELGPGERGEIWFAHPHVMSGYHHDPANTASTLVDGWVGSGDIGSLDARGVLRYEGRIKNLIKRSGENIAGEEVEFTLMAHAAIEEAVVFGVPDEVRTEEVFAVVCVRPGHALAPEQLVAWVGEQLSDWKAPRYIELRTTGFPRLANGKTDRSQVIASADRETAWERPAQRKRSAAQ